MYVITGATGNTGGEIAGILLNHGKKVRAVGRNKNKMNALAQKGAEIAVGSMDNAKFLSQAFEGAEAVYVLIPPNNQAEDLKAFMDTIGESITQALKNSGVSHVVSLSSFGAHLPSGTGPIAHLHNQEQRLNKLDKNVLHLRPTFFMDNFLEFIPMIREMGILGTPVKSDVKIPMIATKDIAVYGANRLGRLDFKGKNSVELLGPRDYSFPEAASILGKAIGKPDIGYIEFNYEDGKQGMIQSGLSEDMAKHYIEMYQSFNDRLIQAVPRTSETTTPTTLEQFAEEIFAPAYKG